MNFKCIILIGCLFLAGCSPFKLGYDYADWFMFWKLNSVFNLTVEQKKLLHPQVDELLAWHKTKELPLYVSLLRQAQEKVKDELTLAELDWVYAQTQERVEQTMRYIAPGFSIFLATLKDQQIERFNQNFFQQKAISPNDEQGDLSEKFIEQIEQWTGELNDDQEKLIIKLRKSIPDISKNRSLQSEKTRDIITSLMAQERNASAIEKKLLELSINYQTTYSEEYGQQVITQQKAFKDMILGIDKMLTPSQRAYFLSKIDLLIEDIESLKEKRDNRFFESLRRIIF